MKTSKLAAVIRKIVREEVQREVKNLLTEQQTTSTDKLTLTEALSQTETEAYPTMREFDATSARAGFASMNAGGIDTPGAFQGHSGKVVSAEQLDPSVSKALTRDYSDLVKRFKK